MAWKFLLFCFFVERASWYLKVFISRKFPNPPPIEKGLKQMFEDGELYSNIPIRYQLEQMKAEAFDENGDNVEIQALESNQYEFVDIEAAKAKLRAKNARLKREVILSVE